MPGFPTLLAFFRESRQPLLYTFIAASALSVGTALAVTIIRVNIAISLIDLGQFSMSANA